VSETGRYGDIVFDSERRLNEVIPLLDGFVVVELLVSRFKCSRAVVKDDGSNITCAGGVRREGDRRRDPSHRDHVDD
jgi:hypothetical protein